MTPIMTTRCFDRRPLRTTSAALTGQVSVVVIGPARRRRVGVSWGQEYRSGWPMDCVSIGPVAGKAKRS